MTLTVPQTGRCLCGAVRYHCRNPLYPPTLCHCESCRRTSGAHAVGWLTVRVEDLAFSGAPPVEFESSPDVRRRFCGRCGSPLTYENSARPGEVDITIGTLDRPDDAVPVDHIWMKDAAVWDRPQDGLPQSPRSRQPR